MSEFAMQQPPPPTQTPSSSSSSYPTTNAQVAPSGSLPPIDDTTMEDIIAKLKLLNYETSFCQTTKPFFKLLSKNYFILQDAKNPNAQFFYFTSLVYWLMSQTGHTSFAPPGQFDDPNVTSTNILEELKTMGLAKGGGIAPNRLRQGYGEAILAVLYLLVERALTAKGFRFQAPQYPQGGRDADEEENEGMILDSSMMEQKEGGGTDSDIDDNADSVMESSEDEDEEYNPGLKGRSKEGESVDEEKMEAILPQVTAEEWNLEVESITPQLQVIQKNEIKDWRSRIQLASVLLNVVKNMYPDIRTVVQRTAEDVEKNRNRIYKREQALSQQFSELVEEYRVKLRELTTSQELYNQASAQVSGLCQELNAVTELLEQTKEDIEDRENKISDTAPLMKIKDALTKVKNEIRVMALRAGVLQHTILHYNFRATKDRKERSTGYEQENEDEWNEKETGVFVGEGVREGEEVQ